MKVIDGASPDDDSKGAPSTGRVAVAGDADANVEGEGSDAVERRLKRQVIRATGGIDETRRLRWQVESLVQEDGCVVFVRQQGGLGLSLGRGLGWGPGRAETRCRVAIEKLSMMGARFTVIELDGGGGAGGGSHGGAGGSAGRSHTNKELSQALLKATGTSDVPSIWIGGKYVGGYDSGLGPDCPGIVDLAFQGELRPMLKLCGAL